MIIDVFSKTITIKILYHGPNLSGKKSSLKTLFARYNKIKDVHVIKNNNNHDLFFERGIIIFKNDNWDIKEFKVHLCTITGHNLYLVTRSIESRTIDGIIFVVDSQEIALKRNIRSLNELYSYFKKVKIPIVFAFNKQDLPTQKKFDPSQFLQSVDYQKFEGVKITKTVAMNGGGVLESFETLLKTIFKKVYRSDSISKMASK